MTRREREQYERRDEEIDHTIRLEWLSRHRFLADVEREQGRHPRHAFRELLTRVSPRSKYVGATRHGRTIPPGVT